MSEQKNSLGMDQKTASWFAYILSALSAIILLVTEKEDKTVRTHAWQSLILACVFWVVMIVLWILIAATVSPFTWGIAGFFSLLSTLVWIAYVVVSIICIVKAVQGDIFKLPVIYNKAANLK
jgi:uncharacterized membrane protein